MIAIYARQSVDRADSISIEQQIEFCSFEARGEEYRTYTDRGYSGKNTERPRFIQMMRDIREGAIDTVIVYKLDRISRSILDFSNMMESFRKYGVKFVSATEKFDTSSPMGNAMLNICIVFAQLERETIQKRVADAYLSRSRKRLYMGGPVPYGFRKVPTVIQGIHTSMYEAVEEEAAVVRLIFEMYSQQGTSYGDVAEYLNSAGIKKRSKGWVRQRIRDMVVNPVYVRADLDVYSFFAERGAVMIDPSEDFVGEKGCYCYKKRSDGSKNGCEIVLAPHSGIVESELWLKCREKSMAQRCVAHNGGIKNSWLCGKLKCGSCGYALTVKAFEPGCQRYLMCSERLNSKGCRGAGTLYAEEIERAVETEIVKKAAYVLNCELKPEWEKLGFEKKRRVAHALIKAVYAADSEVVIQWRV